MVIDTLMAIWNRGYGGRSAMVFSSFVLICISISLLLATTRLSWLALLPQGGAPGNQPGGNRGYVNQTAQANNSTPTIDATAESRPATGAGANACLLTPLPSKTPAARGTLVAPGTGQKSTGSGSSTAPGTSGSGGAHPTPTPNRPVTPTPRPKPTPPVTPSPGGTPTPVPTLTPISTATPAETPTPTPTIAPTEMPTPTTPPASPTVPPTATTGNGANTNGQHSLDPGGSSSTGRTGVPGRTRLPGGNGMTWNPNCFSASLAAGGSSSVMFSLPGSLWLILAGAALCTLLFCAGRWLCSHRNA